MTSVSQLQGLPLRRQPVQERSIARVDHILDTCAHLLDELGYDALSTTRVAQRAETSIGSVYQFVHDKHAMLCALAHRYLTTYLDRLTDRLTDATIDRRETAHEALSLYINMHRDTVGFAVLRFGDHDDLYHFVAYDSIDIIADHLISRLRSHCALPAAYTNDLIRALEASFAVTRRAFRRHDNGDPDLLAAAAAEIDHHVGRTRPAKVQKTSATA